MMLSQLCSRNGIRNRCSIITRFYDVKYTGYISTVQKLVFSRKNNCYRGTNWKQVTRGFSHTSSLFSNQNMRDGQANEEEEVIPSFTHEAEAEKLQGQIFYSGMVPIQTLVERLNAFEELGVKKEDFQQYPSVLFTDFEKSYTLLNTVCKELKSDGHSLFPLLQLQEKTIELYLKIVPHEYEFLQPHENRIKYFSKKLEVPERAITEKLLRYPHLLSLPAKRIADMMGILLDAGVDRKHIYYDLWAFKFNLQQAKERLSAAQQAGRQELKPWLVRCPDSIFQRTIHQRKTQQLFSDRGCWEENVAQLFECPVEEVETMLKYNPRVSKTNLPKMQATAEILMAEGFGTKQILRNPRIFLQISTSTLKERLELMREFGLEPKEVPNCLSVLTVNHNKYRDYVKKLVHRLHNTESDVDR